jgi:DNA primase|tara:strand:+ start:3843 stop:4535 length:693 start_codon:yes stop_codon:yes gene_type:complete
LNEDVVERETVNPDTLRYKLLKGLISEHEVFEISIDELKVDYETTDKLSTLTERGFEIDTLKYFEVCFSEKKNRVVIPVRDSNYKLVAMIGRAVLKDQEPRYLYSRGFKRAKVLFNLCNAKRYDSVVVTEGSLDAIKIHQAGFPNVVATLGSAVSDEQFRLLSRYFDEIIIFPDKDDAGEAMRCSIIDRCRGKKVRWARCPEGRGDPGDMTAAEISEAINDSKITLTLRR